ncbi:MAG: hypothetical protein FJX57_04625 [Alphaproteobacteria bacterium]|nr:hypothetical protein [Alphaproteobacteria bacterium]
MNRITSNDCALPVQAPGNDGHPPILAAAGALESALPSRAPTLGAVGLAVINDEGDVLGVRPRATVTVAKPARPMSVAATKPEADLVPPAPSAPAAPAILDALGVAVILCTEAGKLTFMSTAARALLSRGDALQLQRQPNGSHVLVASDRQATSRLERAIAAAAASDGLGGAAGTSLALARAQHAVPLLLTIAPFAAAADQRQALVVVGDPDAEDRDLAARLRSAYGLTPAETRLAVALTRGVCRKAYARSIGVKPSTVKTQITNLFAKTGTHRESDLVRVLMTVPRLAWPGR